MIQFGIPKRVVENKERYPDTPVITMERVEDKGFNRRFVLNNKAIELLQVIPGISQVCFAFDGENSAYISKNATEDSLMVGKNMAFSNKKYYEYISKMYKLNSNEDNDFELTDVISVGDVVVYRMKHLNSCNPIEERNPVLDKEIEHITGSGENSNFEDLLKESDDDILEHIIEEEVDEDTGEIIGRGKERFLMNAY